MMKIHLGARRLIHSLPSTQVIAKAEETGISRLGFRRSPCYTLPANQAASWQDYSQPGRSPPGSRSASQSPSRDLSSGQRQRCRRL